MRVEDAIMAVEERLRSLPSKEDDIADPDEVRFMLVGTDIDLEEFQECIEMFGMSVTNAIVAEGAPWKAALRGAFLQAILTGVKVGEDADN
jgi:hypothetical protein